MRIIALLVALVLLAAAAAVISADLAGNRAPEVEDAAYDLSWWTADGGGGRSESAGGQFKLHATLGQPDAGSLSGAGYQLDGGFWVNPIFYPGGKVYLPVVVRS
jgi:hypothetical protein